MKLSPARAILAIVAVKDMELHQMDIVTAFLNGHLDEEVYKEQPTGFVAKGLETCVCGLIRAMYGLKQGHRQWHLVIHSFLVNELKLEANDADSYVFKMCESNDFVIIAFYVDALLIESSSTALLSRITSRLRTRFKMNDLGEARIWLGFEIRRNHEKKERTLCQFQYT